MASRPASERRTILVTGGTGTLGAELVARLARAAGRVGRRARARYASGRVARCCHQASERSRATCVKAPDVRPRCVSRARRFASSVTDIVHCAADTTFNRPLADARAANVAGTEAVLAFAKECRHLQRMACFSTVYVAGRTTGCFAEADVGGADGFVNSYEQSKAEMEAVVRDAMRDLPIAIYRLSTIIGDSRTGEVTVSTRSITRCDCCTRVLRRWCRAGRPAWWISSRWTSPLTRVTICSSTNSRAGATYHLCAGAAGSATLGALLDATMTAFERYRPAWRKRSIARPGDRGAGDVRALRAICRGSGQSGIAPGNASRPGVRLPARVSQGLR